MEIPIAVVWGGSHLNQVPIRVMIPRLVLAIEAWQGGTDDLVFLDFWEDQETSRMRLASMA